LVFSPSNARNANEEDDLMQLADRKCSSCEQADAPMQHETAMEMAGQVPEWTVGKKHIERTFTFPNFVDAVRFGNEVAEIAEEENHHPEMHISWGKVRVELSTHKIGGLSESDFIVAAKIDRIAREPEGRAAI
jgi:4a-hydroxytetrahydrobiopterin dehydratase